MSVGLHAMQHDTDPRQVILDQVGDIEDIEVGPCKVLVATYIRPERTKGGLVLPDVIRGEDVFQGKVGLVLKAGPLCFQDSSDHKFGGFSAEPGDWVMYRVSDGFMMKLAGQQKGEHCRIIEDALIMAKLSRPDAVL